eukprot:3778137-Rhodomonas_salina.2
MSRGNSEQASLGESPSVILAGQSGNSLALARLVSEDGSWIEAHEVKRHLCDNLDDISTFSCFSRSENTTLTPGVFLQVEWLILRASDAISSCMLVGHTLSRMRDHSQVIEGKWACSRELRAAACKQGEGVSKTGNLSPALRPAHETYASACAACQR